MPTKQDERSVTLYDLVALPEGKRLVKVACPGLFDTWTREFDSEPEATSWIEHQKKLQVLFHP